MVDRPYPFLAASRDVYHPRGLFTIGASAVTQDNRIQDLERLVEQQATMLLSAATILNALSQYIQRHAEGRERTEWGTWQALADALVQRTHIHVESVREHH